MNSQTPRFTVHVTDVRRRLLLVFFHQNRIFLDPKTWGISMRKKLKRISFSRSTRARILPHIEESKQTSQFLIKSRNLDLVHSSACLVTVKLKIKYKITKWSLHFCLGYSFAEPKPKSQTHKVFFPKKTLCKNTLALIWLGFSSMFQNAVSGQCLAVGNTATNKL